MNESKLIKVVIIVVLLGLIGYFGYNWYQSMQTSPQTAMVKAPEIPVTPIPTPQTTSTTAAPIDSTSMTKSSDAREIVVEGSSFKFVPNTITVKKGEKIRILFKNTGGFHDLVIDELNVKTPRIKDGEESFVEFTPTQTGSFSYYCSVGTHRAMGMEGTLTVE